MPLGVWFRVHLFIYLAITPTVVLGPITQWIPTVDPCVLVKVGLLSPTVG